MKVINLGLTTIVFLLSFELLATTRINGLEFNRVSSDQGKVVIKFSGDLNKEPELSFIESPNNKKSTIQLVLPDAVVWPKIEKKAKVFGNKFDTSLTAYQFNKSVVRFRAILPKNLKEFKDKMKVIVGKKEINILFPLIKKMENGPLDKFVSDVKAKKRVKLNEDLIKEIASDKRLLTDNENSDKVKMQFSGNEKGRKNKHLSLLTYAGKFSVFLLVILITFYAVISFLKKKVISKGKIGFLNSSELVSIINTTYISPKKSLVLIKAHKQVFLVGVDDNNGMSLISEIDNVTGLMKSGEKEATGKNFDTSMSDATKEDKSFSLKEIVAPITEENSSSENVEIKQEMVPKKNKLSEQIKDKVKKLKPLQ
jgi:flagellar biogenesis protein FliO